MVSSKGKPTDPKLREEAKEGMYQRPSLGAILRVGDGSLFESIRRQANAQQGWEWKRPNGSLEGKNTCHIGFSALSLLSEPVLF